MYHINLLFTTHSFTHSLFPLSSRLSSQDRISTNTEWSQRTWLTYCIVLVLVLVQWWAGSAVHGWVDTVHRRWSPAHYYGISNEVLLAGPGADILFPFVTGMVNASLAQGRLLVSERHAVIIQRGLDAADVANYRPVSNVSFSSKLVERVVATRLHKYLSWNDLLPSCQSAYTKHFLLGRRCYASGQTLWQQRTSVKCHC